MSAIGFFYENVLVFLKSQVLSMTCFTFVLQWCSLQFAVIIISSYNLLVLFLESLWFIPCFFLATMAFIGKMAFHFTVLIYENMVWHLLMSFLLFGQSIYFGFWFDFIVLQKNKISNTFITIMSIYIHGSACFLSILEHFNSQVKNDNFLF